MLKQLNLEAKKIPSGVQRKQRLKVKLATQDIAYNLAKFGPAHTIRLAKERSMKLSVRDQGCNLKWPRSKYCS